MLTADTYNAALSSIEKKLPDLYLSLKATESGRARRLAQYANGARLRGADELLRHLRLLEQSLGARKHENDVGFLVARARADFEIAVEAALGGVICITHDAMRDAMEIEFLLREFEADPAQLDRWLNASQVEVKTIFSPNALRQRHAAREKVNVKDLSEHSDYKGHSMSLHVTPWRNPIFKKGIVEETDLPFGPDMAFWEIFFHARRLMLALHRLLQHPRFAGVSNPDPQTFLPLVASAFERTQEMQAAFFAFIKASSKEHGDSDDV